MTQQQLGAIASAAVRTMRPHNAALAAASTAVGAWIGAPSTESMRELLGSASPWWLATAAALAVGAANLYNDARDADADRINAPHRAIPRGQLSVRQAERLAVVAGVLAVISGTCARASVGGWIALAVMAGLVYSRGVKSTVLVGNVWVAVLSAATLPAGAFVAGELTAEVWWAAGLMVLYITGREVLKSIADVSGDTAVATRTVATVWGTARASAVVLGVAVLMTGWALGAALGTVVLPAQAAVLWGAGVVPMIAAWGMARQGRAPLRRSLLATKIGGAAMLIALVALHVP